MDIIIITILLITTLLSFAAFYIAFSNHLKIKKNKVQLYQNNVHFYVARDKNERLFLYLSKPFRRGDEFFSNERGNIMLRDIKCFGLNPDDFKDLKWEDEPVEVFLNLED